MTTLRKRAHGRLFFEDWSIMDPVTLHRDDDDSVLGRAHRACHPMLGYAPETVTLSREDVIALKGAADAYHHLTTHPAGTESTVRQLRAIRRALRTTP